jgi:hypothetical protein
MKSPECKRCRGGKWSKNTFHAKEREKRKFGQRTNDAAEQGDQGPMLSFLKYFCRKFQRKNWRFWLKTKLNYAKFDHNIGFWENANFFDENCRKSQKIVIITSTPDWANLRPMGNFQLRVFFWKLQYIHSSPKFCAVFFNGRNYVLIQTRMGWASFWSIFSPTHLVTLPLNGNKRYVHR